MYFFLFFAKFPQNHPVCARAVDFFSLLFYSMHIQYLMFNTQEGRISMKQKKQGRSFAGTVVNLLNTSLMVDANTTTCVGFYQPEAPKELSRFKKSK